MFTGLVEGKGTLVRREPRGPGARLTVRSPPSWRTPEAAAEPLQLGESIAVDGCCLSVVSVVGDGFEFDASAETLARTTLGELHEGSEVNLERAMKAHDRLGGHIVTGHVDDVATLLSREPMGEAAKLSFRLPARLLPYVAEKGSITLCGVSLTINGVSADGFDVAIIPITQEVTTLGALRVGARVNVEVDLLARYVARMLQFAPSERS